jgi:hypothetical protein
MASNTDIHAHMEIVSSDIRHIGTVDRLEVDGRIRMARGDSADGKHHFVPTNWVNYVGSTVYLDRPADEVLGAI